MPLYRTQSPYNSAVSALGNAAGTASSMTKKTEYTAPKKTLGGGLAAGIGGAWAGMQAAEYMEPGTTKALYHPLGDMFSAPANAAANTGAAQAMTTGAEAAKTGIAQGIGGSMSAEGVGATASQASTALQSAPAVAGAAQTLTTGAEAATAGAAASGTTAGLAGTAGAGLAGAGATGVAAGTTAATSAATAGAASAGGTLAGTTAGGEAGATVGPVGAGVGALVGLSVGLLSYYL